MSLPVTIIPISNDTVIKNPTVTGIRRFFDITFLEFILDLFSHKDDFDPTRSFDHVPFSRSAVQRCFGGESSCFGGERSCFGGACFGGECSCLGGACFGGERSCFGGESGLFVFRRRFDFDYSFDDKIFVLVFRYHNGEKFLELSAETTPVG